MKTLLKVFTCTCMLASCSKEKLSAPLVISLEKTDITTAHFIGEAYGGGVVFYIDSTGQHGLIEARNDISTTSTWWNGAYLSTGATKTGIGDGAKNTKKIIQSQGRTGNYAALLCAQYKNDGYTDWYLPSKDELNEIYKVRNIVGVTIYPHWSSSEWKRDSIFAWAQFFEDGNQGANDKKLTYAVLPIRSF
jgi:Protein of unknown function (DUF1566)